MKAYSFLNSELRERRVGIYLDAACSDVAHYYYYY